MFIKSYADRWKQLKILDKARAIGEAKGISDKLSKWKAEINEDRNKLEVGIISVIKTCPCTSWPIDGYYEINIPE